MKMVHDPMKTLIFPMDFSIGCPILTPWDHGEVFPPTEGPPPGPLAGCAPMLGSSMTAM